MSENYELKTGSKYLIRTCEEEDTIGHMAGYAMIGSESALVINVVEGRIRYIPVSQISFMELLESAEEEEKKPVKGTELLYG